MKISANDFGDFKIKMFADLINKEKDIAVKLDLFQKLLDAVDEYNDRISHFREILRKNNELVEVEGGKPLPTGDEIAETAIDDENKELVDILFEGVIYR